MAHRSRPQTPQRFVAKRTRRIDEHVNRFGGQLHRASRDAGPRKTNHEVARVTRQAVIAYADIVYPLSIRQELGSQHGRSAFKGSTPGIDDPHLVSATPQRHGGAASHQLASPESHQLRAHVVGCNRNRASQAVVVIATTRDDGSPTVQREAHDTPSSFAVVHHIVDHRIPTTRVSCPV